MPHCILEYTDNIPNPPEMRTLLVELNRRLAATGMFDPSDIKSRAIVHRDYVIGDGDPARAFVTLNIAILSSRPTKVKEQISDLAISLLQEKFSDCLGSAPWSLTVQVSELDRECYRKIVNYGTPHAAPPA